MFLDFSLLHNEIKLYGLATSTNIICYIDVVIFFFCFLQYLIIYNSLSTGLCMISDLALKIDIKRQSHLEPCIFPLHNYKM